MDGRMALDMERFPFGWFFYGGRGPA